MTGIDIRGALIWLFVIGCVCGALLVLAAKFVMAHVSVTL